MKVLLAENQQQYDAAVSEAQQRVRYLQQALDAYTTFSALVGIATVPTVAELGDLQTNPQEFIFKMIMNRQPLAFVGGITIPNEKAYDLIAKPNGTNEFVARVTDIFKGDNTNYFTSKLVDVTSYELVAGKLVLTQATKDSIKENSRVYATTQAQVDEWAQIQAIATALNTIRVMPRFGRTFDALHYLEKALVATENLEDNRPAAGNAQFVVNPR